MEAQNELELIIQYQHIKTPTTAPKVKKGETSKCSQPIPHKKINKKWAEEEINEMSDSENRFSFSLLRDHFENIRFSATVFSP